MLKTVPPIATERATVPPFTVPPGAARTTVPPTMLRTVPPELETVPPDV